MPHNATPPVVEAKVIAGLAAGLSAEEVARGLALHASTVRRIALREQNATILQKLRAEIRANTVEALRTTQPKLLDRLAREIDSGTPKDVDAMSRAALNVEKTISSAVGERFQPAGAERPTQIVIRFADWVPPMQRAEVIDVRNEAPEALQPAPEEAELEEAPEALASQAPALASTDPEARPPDADPDQEPVEAPDAAEQPAGEDEP